MLPFREAFKRKLQAQTHGAFIEQGH
jgi:hypothetical protein